MAFTQATNCRAKSTVTRVEVADRLSRRCQVATSGLTSWFPAAKSVFVLTAQGDGRFKVTWSGAADGNAVDLAIADLDEGGLADLAVANHGTEQVAGPIHRRRRSKRRFWRGRRLSSGHQMTTLDTLRLMDGYIMEP